MKKKFLVASFLSILSFHSYLISLPVVNHIQQGSVMITEPSTGNMQITASDKSIIYFDSFNINPNELVQFSQPSTNAQVLGRILDTSASQINGTLQSNGQLFLINPQGFAFGGASVVNVGSLIASVLDISDQDFSDGTFQFTLSSPSSTSEILNQGNLTSNTGPIALLAPNITNQGTIQALADKVLLASAETIVLDFSGDGLLSFALSGDLAGGFINHSGFIEALNGQVHMALKTAIQAVQSVVNTNGIKPAEVMVEENGYIALNNLSQVESPYVSVDAQGPCIISLIGANIASQQTNGSDLGGYVEVLADTISVIAGNIDASGNDGGGTILIGGNYLGQGTPHTALNTTIISGAILNANANIAGNGGRIIVWADQNTTFGGFGSVQGGAIMSGDGGFAETSGMQSLSVIPGSNIDTTAPNGMIGMWLLDPPVITIRRPENDLLKNMAKEAFTIDPVTINQAKSAMTLCADVQVIDADINPNHPLTFHSEFATILNANVKSTSSITFSGAGTLIVENPSSIQGSKIELSQKVISNYPLDVTETK